MYVSIMDPKGNRLLTQMVQMKSFDEEATYRGYG